MPVGIENNSSESRGPSKYQNSLRSSQPFVSNKYLIYSNFPSPFSSQDGRIGGKRLYQVNLCSSLTCLPIFIVLARPEVPNSPKHWVPPPNSHKESGSSKCTSIMYLRHLLTLPTKFHPDFSTLIVFQDFRFAPPTLPNVNRSGWDFK